MKKVSADHGVAAVAVVLATAGLVVASPRTPRTVDASAEVREILERTRGYERFPMARLRDEPALTPGHGPWGGAYFNAVAVASIGDAKPLREGSVIVRENRPHPLAPPNSLSTMYKRADGWYWIEHTFDGKVLVKGGQPVAGRVQACIDCHRRALDMVFRTGEPLRRGRLER